MRRYRGADKPPGHTLSPPPYSRLSPGTTSRARTGSSTKTPPKQGVSHTVSNKREHDLMIRGSGTTTAYLDPRTKKPIIPQAGRFIPKLKMSHLTSSLTPMLDSQIIPDYIKAPLSDRRNAAMKVIKDKDMVESFDDAIRVPDLRAINSKVSQIKQNISYPAKVSNASVANSVVKNKMNNLYQMKESSKLEEKNLKKLMGQLRDKYMEDMESQLGLAIERKPKRPSKAYGDSMTSDPDQSGDDVEIEIPRPSTNATEITTRIDKVVREMAAESQKLNKPDKYKPSLSSTKTRANKSPPASPQTLKNLSKVNGNPTPLKNVAPEKNKNLAKISNAFRKSLDPFTKRDVRELIKLPENSPIGNEKFEEEHEERVKAHEAVFKNAITSSPSIQPSQSEVGRKNEEKTRRESNKSPVQTESRDTNKSIESEHDKSNKLTKPTQINPKLKPFAEAIGLAKDDENEVYEIIKEHINYEMASGPPKISAPSGPRKSNFSSPSASKSVLDPITGGKLEKKFNKSQKKLQNLVDSFTLKVESPRRKYGNEFTFAENEDELRVPSLSSMVSLSSQNTRRENASAAKSTVSKSMKTIDRASAVAQRLGTLMSRIAVRNEAYDYEKEQEIKQKSISVPLDSPPSSSYSIRQLSTPSSLLAQSSRPNPYESSTKFNIPPGVSKMDSSHFDKYVEEMKKVAEKAANSFEKFKQQHDVDDTELVSFSEDEEDSEAEYSYHSDDTEFKVAAAAAAEIAAEQDKRKVVEAPKNLRFMTPVKTHEQTLTRTSKRTNVSVGNSARELNTNISMNYSRNRDSEVLRDFDFTSEMSSQDQLMLQKLRKLKEKEGWGDVTREPMGIGDVPTSAGIESLIKTAEMDRLNETEMGSLGPVSLNAILRARMNRNSVGKTLPK